MAKVMLVEDDNNLREIYEARLAAEGYEIVAAQDGEEALALAVKERPDLIIADIMMPKVSGFDMLDILRSTPETKHTKIIMMTALSQAEDKARAEKLGADRYLVKSQVTLEDVVKVASEMLNDQSGGSSNGPADDSPVTDPVSDAPTIGSSNDSGAAPADDKPADEPVTPPPADDPAAASTATQQSDTTATEEADVTKQIDDFISKNPTLSTAATPPPETAPAEPAAATDEPGFKEETISGAPAVNDASKSKTIPVTVHSDEPEKSDADKTMANAVDTLANAGGPTQPPENAENTLPNPATDDDGKPKPAEKKGGERVIQPLTDPTQSAGPSLDELLAREESNNGIAPPPVNAVIAPGGAVTHNNTPIDPAAPAQPAFTDSSAAPGVVQAPVDPGINTPPTTPPANANNISL